MKKVFVSTAAAVLALTMGSAVAQDQAGGSSSGAFGEVKATTIAAGVVGVAVAAAVISNSRGTTIDIIDPPLECGPGEIEVDGECVPDPGTGTVTVTATGTATSTVTVTSTN